MNFGSRHLLRNTGVGLYIQGCGHDPLRRDLDKFIDETQKRVNGKVKLRMHNGSLRVTGRESGLFTL